jgi:hypothetical protein
MRIETRAEVAAAVERLERRSPAALAAFILSLAQHGGPVGEQVRTFVVGDDPAATVASLEERIAALRESPAAERRDRFGEDVGRRLDYILEAVETLVLPRDPRAAFELLVRLVQADGNAMEQCGDHHDAVASALERTVGLVAQAAQTLPTDEVRATLQQLIAEDDYGTRRGLIAVVSALASEGELASRSPVP